jgi:hypothetical protein
LCTHNLSFEKNSKQLFPTFVVDLYVDKSGSESADCGLKESSPCDTIQFVFDYHILRRDSIAKMSMDDEVITDRTQ